MMNDIKKKKIAEEFYIFCIHWDSNRPTYLLILTEALTITLLSTYRFVVF